MTRSHPDVKKRRNNKDFTGFLLGQTVQVEAFLVNFRSANISLWWSDRSIASMPQLKKSTFCLETVIQKTRNILLFPRMNRFNAVSSEVNVNQLIHILRYSLCYRFIGCFFFFFRNPLSSHWHLSSCSHDDVDGHPRFWARTFSKRSSLEKLVCIEWWTTTRHSNSWEHWSNSPDLAILTVVGLIWIVRQALRSINLVIYRYVDSTSHPHPQDWLFDGE